MKTKDLCMIAIMASILSICFSLLSSILYLEIITLVLVAFALSSKPRNAFYATIIFTICIIINTGFNTFTLMYMLVYSTYTIITISLKKHLLKHPSMAYIYVGLLSFMTGQLLDLSFIIFSSKITLIYIIMGLKTSLIQGIIAGISAMFLIDPLLKILERLFKNYETK